MFARGLICTTRNPRTNGGSPCCRLTTKCGASVTERQAVIQRTENGGGRGLGGAGLLACEGERQLAYQCDETPRVLLGRPGGLPPRGCPLSSMWRRRGQSMSLPFPVEIGTEK